MLTLFLSSVVLGYEVTSNIDNLIARMKLDSARAEAMKNLDDSAKLKKEWEMRNAELDALEKRVKRK